MKIWYCPIFTWISAKTFLWIPVLLWSGKCVTVQAEIMCSVQPHWQEQLHGGLILGHKNVSSVYSTPQICQNLIARSLFFVSLNHRLTQGLNHSLFFFSVVIPCMSSHPHLHFLLLLSPCVLLYFFILLREWFHSHQPISLSFFLSFTIWSHTFSKLFLFSWLVSYYPLFHFVSCSFLHGFAFHILAGSSLLLSYRDTLLLFPLMIHSRAYFFYSSLSFPSVFFYQLHVYYSSSRFISLHPRSRIFLSVFPSSPFCSLWAIALLILSDYLAQGRPRGRTPL